MTALCTVRDGDKIEGGASTWERSERFFEENGLYYFATREGVNVGPFASCNMAKRALELYKYIVNDCSATGTYASQIVTRL